MIAGSHGESVFNFVRNRQAVSEGAVPFCIPTSSERDFLLLCIPASVWCSVFGCCSVAVAPCYFNFLGDIRLLMST